MLDIGFRKGSHNDLDVGDRIVFEEGGGVAPSS